MEESRLSPTGWWNVHTHRKTGDMHHAVWCCGWRDWPEASSEMPPYVSVGIHPWHLAETNFSEQWQWLTQAVRDKRVVAIGEAGLDKVVGVPFDLQRHAFRQVALLAEEMNLPLLIHAVKAFNEVIALKKELHPCNPWIIHGFRGKKELAQTCLRHGLYLSFGEKYQEEALCVTPLEYLLLETDESAVDIRELYRRASLLKRITEEELREKAEQNIRRLFFKD